MHNLARAQDHQAVIFAEIVVVQKDATGSALQDNNGNTLLRDDIVAHFSITKRPTIIAFKDGNEISRVEKEEVTTASVSELVAQLKL